jgi:hypothetical protein
MFNQIEVMFDGLSKAQFWRRICPWILGQLLIFYDYKSIQSIFLSFHMYLEHLYDM